MKRTFGKLITMLLCLTMLVSMLPATALAAPSLDDITDRLPTLDEIGKLPELAATPTPADPTGACGTSMHWHLSGGTLTISGNGAMFDWSGSKHAPWYAYRGNIKTVVVEMGVPSIGAYAFDGLTNLTAIELPASIERIGNYAFESCVKLADITLPDSITEIGIGAFENCTALTKVTLPAAIHKASDNLFKGCTALTGVIFPVGETELGASAFEGCSSLETVVWHELTKIGAKAFSGCTNMTLINFPDTLTEIGKDAFSGSGLKLVRLPMGLTTIDFLAGTDKLTTVFIPASVKEIADGQFANCKDLKQVDYEGSKLDWKNIRIEANNDMLQNAEFSYNRTDNFLYADVVVTSMPVVTVTPAPTAAPTPTPVNTPAPTGQPGDFESGNTCGEKATWSYDAATNTLTISGEGPMAEGARSENGILVSYSWYKHESEIKTVVVEDGITHISNNAFKNFTALTKVTLPKSVTSMGFNVFLSCDKLTEIHYGGSEAEWKAIEINPEGNNLLNSVTITYSGEPVAPTPTPVATPNPNLPGGECGEKAKWSFDESTGTLTIYGEGEMALTLYDEDYNIQNAPWYNYRNKITSVNVSRGITTIDYGAFSGLKRLENVSLPEGLTYISDSVFSNCEALKTVVIPDTVTEMGSSVFHNCTSLTEITFPDSITKIGTRVFYNCPNLTKAVLSKNMTVIPNGTFYGCKNLVYVQTHDGLTTIEDDAFYRCEKLKNIYIPASVTEMGSGVFYYCYALESAIVPKGVTDIQGTFGSCKSLKYVSLPKSLVEIHDRVFAEIENLTDIYYEGSEADWNALLIDEEYNDILFTNKVTIHYNSYKPSQPVITPAPTAAPTPEVTPEPTAAPTPAVTPTPQDPNGKCGDNLTWVLDEEKGILTISGTGAMYDYELYEGEMAPWHEYRDVIAYVWIEEGITKLGAVAFADMKFGSIVIPDGITELPSGLLLGTPIGWISLPESLKKIDLRALECYSNLGSAFGTISTMSQVHFRGTKDQWFTIEIGEHNRIDGADMYYNSKYLRTPYGCSGPCGDSSTWNFNNETKTMTISGTGAAVNDTWQGVVSSMVSSSNIEHAVIEFGITSIGGLFNQHDSLKTVTIAGTVKTIGPDAFYSCGDLVEVTLSEGIETIGEDAFGECGKLSEIVIPEGVTTIGTRAFAEDPLKKLTLPATLKTVDYNAFRYCGQLQTVHFNGTEADWKANVKLEEGNETLTSATMTFGNQPRPTVQPTATPDVTPNVTPDIKPTTKPTPTVKPQPPVEPTVNPELDPETCKHTLFFVAPQDATCTEDGFTGKVICGKGCGYVLQEGRVKPALGHKYKSGTCTRCGHIEGTPEPTPTPPTAGDTPFVDMTENDWFYEPVRWAVQNGITGGTSENTFSPNMTCTRAQIVTFLWAAAGKPEPTSKSPFSDVKEGDWFYQPVIWAVENDITSGTTATTFSPNIPCSRAQVVALLYKAMQSPAVENLNNPFADVLESNYFHKAVMWALENGIASGMTAELFGSSQPCTRAQIAMFLYKAYN